MLATGLLAYLEWQHGVKSVAPGFARSADGRQHRIHDIRHDIQAALHGRQNSLAQMRSSSAAVPSLEPCVEHFLGGDDGGWCSSTGWD